MWYWTLTLSFMWHWTFLCIFKSCIMLGLWGVRDIPVKSLVNESPNSPEIPAGLESGNNHSGTPDWSTCAIFSPTKTHAQLQQPHCHRPSLVQFQSTNTQLDRTLKIRLDNLLFPRTALGVCLWRAAGGSVCWGNLGREGPWNQPLRDRRHFSDDKTSATWDTTWT